MAFSKLDITLHRDGFRDGKPAINVKCHNFGRERDSEGRFGAERLAAETGLSEERAAVLFERAWEWQTSDFWGYIAEEAAERHLRAAFGQYDTRPFVCYGEGRSGGWLTVEFKPVKGMQGPANALVPVESWNAIQVTAWGRFEAAIRAEIDYLASYATVKEALAEGGELDPEAEREEAKSAAERIAEPFGYAVVDTRAAS